MEDEIEKPKSKVLKQFEFTVTIKAADIFEAQNRAKELFGEKILEEEVSWTQVFKNKEPVPIIIQPQSFEL